MLDMFEPFIGVWEATDGSSRQELTWGLDRRVIQTRMWFRDGDAWKLVSEGSFHTDPGRQQVVGFAVVIDMPVSHFDIAARFGDDGLEFDNQAYAADGTPLVSKEFWRQEDGPDHYSWHLFQNDNGDLAPWMDGEWKRIPSDENLPSPHDRERTQP